MTAADELEAAWERIRLGDSRIDITLRGPLIDWLDSATEAAEDGHPDEYALAMARAINGQP